VLAARRHLFTLAQSIFPALFVQGRFLSAFGGLLFPLLTAEQPEILPQFPYDEPGIPVQNPDFGGVAGYNGGGYIPEELGRQHGIAFFHSRKHVDIMKDYL